VIFGAITQSQLTMNTQQRLVALRTAFQGVQELYAWTSGQSAAALEGMGFSASDANALASINATGLPPSTYPQPGTAYVYAASQNAVIGPQ
jgi:hypothetical protein